MTIRRKLILVLTSVALLLLGGFGRVTTDNRLVSYVADLQKQQVKLYWKDDKGEILKSIGNLKNYVAGQQQELVFAMNAGMFQWDHTPQGLFVQNYKPIHAMDTTSGRGNFYLKPNGIFAITRDNQGLVQTTETFIVSSKVKYATQSGPMLVIDGKLHPAFRQGSENLNIRNGVGVLPDGKILFAISREPVNFYDFASFFQKAGCKNALYLDGAVSRAYIPEKQWLQTDGDFGVMIGIAKPTSK